jgi:hypothetical protein
MFREFDLTVLGVPLICSILLGAISYFHTSSYFVSYHYLEAKANYKYGEGYCFVNLKGGFDFNKTPGLILKAVKSECIEFKTKEVILTNVSRVGE